MIDFSKLPDDERRQWRDDPVTESFIAWLRSEAGAMNTAAISAIRSASSDTSVSISAASTYVGKLEAYEHAIDTATRESFE